MELVYFILLCIYGFTLILLNNKNLIKYTYIPFFICFLIIVRISGYDVDINTYSTIMQADYFSFDMMREFVFWGSIRSLYSLFNNDLLVFIFIDLFWIYLYYKVIQKYTQTFKYRFDILFIVFTLSFPFLLGYENIIRQHIAFIIFLYAYIIRYSSANKSNFIFLLSILVHNSMLVFLPLLILIRFSSFTYKQRFNLFLVLSVIFTLLLLIMSKFKSNTSTGLDFSIIYLAIFFSVFYILFMKYRFKILKTIRKFPALFLAILYIGTLVIMGNSSQAERLGMIFLLLSTIEYFQYIQKFIFKRYIYLLIFLVLVVPIFIFGSTMKFLT